ncbi:hypothetical protein KQH49_10185 [Mycetohabitans sp. B5]|uniref:hypothetical protein n=1 Tax=Mycetohabitans TaxID=2571159 RepID=UPI001F36FC75|nr:hypothetical protein [Mycetohabitans sp. B5]MCG1055286.1 hypothetical protein [Mycetohabitans sp. B5]
MDKVELSCQPVEGPDTDVPTTVQHLRVTLSGVVTVDDNICIREILQGWTSSATLAGHALIVDEADTQLHLLPTPYH